jgi:CcmD family protein
MDKAVKTKSIFSFVLLFLAPLILFAQEGQGQDFLRNIGKIYVVVAVIVIIFIGIVLFLFFLDRRIRKIENQIFENE